MGRSGRQHDPPGSTPDEDDVATLPGEPPRRRPTPVEPPISESPTLVLPDDVPPEEHDLSDDDRFVVVEAVGRGGSATVYKVWDRLVERYIALKELNEELAGDPRLVHRFVDEARITGKLDHPHIAPVYDLGEDEDGACWFRMKLVRGQNLRELVLHQGDTRLQPDVLAANLRALAKVCDALAFAHHRGVLHLDVKPSNIMVDDFGQVYLMDWGVARRTSQVDGETQFVGGTPSFLPPEQAAGGRIDARTDVFAVGTCLYWLLTATAPYPGDPHTALARASLGRFTPPKELEPTLPPALVAICHRAMRVDPDERYAGATALRDDLYAFLEGEWYLEEVRYPSGAMIVREGDPGDCAYILTDGACDVFTERGGERRLLRTLGPGDVFGETAVFTGKPRSASVATTAPSTVRRVTEATLSQELGRNRWLGAFVHAVAERFREADARLREQA